MRKNINNKKNKDIARLSTVKKILSSKNKEKSKTLKMF